MQVSTESRFGWVALMLACLWACSPAAGTSTAGQPAETDAGPQPASAEGAGTTGSPAADAGRVPVPTDAGAVVPPAGPRRVLVGQVENARDLGGIAISGGHVKAGKLFRGPPLAELTEAGCAEVAELGLHSVIDLRIASEVSLLPDQPCVLEQGQAQLVAAPLPVPYNVSAQDYIAVLDARESMLNIFETLADEARYPVYFHCTWGRDRTGIVAAVILLALGASPDAIMEDYLASRETVGAYPASLEAALGEITRRGGIEAYLTALGVSDAQLAVLRAQRTR